jgi:hypothetical protein
LQNTNLKVSRIAQAIKIAAGALLLVGMFAAVVLAVLFFGLPGHLAAPAVLAMALLAVRAFLLSTSGSGSTAFRLATPRRPGRARLSVIAEQRPQY